MNTSKILLLLIPLMFSSCRAPTGAITSSESQLMIRQAQTREYENVTKKQAMRASISALQDLDFILDKVDADLGMISASKYQHDMLVKITICVGEKGSDNVSVRASATYGIRPIEDPITYQDFFSVFDKSLFFVKNQVD